jgi:hypothetical protein
MLGVSAWKTNAAVAAGATLSTATAARVVTNIAAANASSGLLLALLVKLPVIAWAYKITFDEARSKQERQLLYRFILGQFAGLTVFGAAVLSTVWWQHQVEPEWIRGLLIPGMMVMFLIPMILTCRWLGKRIERIRILDGTFNPPRPLIECDVDGRHVANVRRLFCLSALLVVIWPGILAIVARD